MDIQLVLDYFSLYGTWFLFAIVFLEYLNLPGFPAGIIMPAAGILIATNELNFAYALFISVIAGLLGSYVLYAIGYYLGRPAIEKVYSKFPKTKKPIDKTFHYLDKYGNLGMLISRIIPVARTLISFVAGAFNVKFIPFTIYSLIGISIWNFTLILAGYLIGYAF